MRRLVADLRELRCAVAGLFSGAPDEERTRYEITVSARNFSRRARQKLDDKLSFTATLMRAGEVEAANRLLSEVERDVRDEEATLFERVNEARAAASVRRQAMTRLRLARVLATAMVGATLLAFSAVGMSLAAWLGDRNESGSSGASSRAAEIEKARFASLSFQGRLTPLNIAGIRFKLDEPQLKRFERLTSATGDPAALQRFLLGLLPPELADRVHKALVTTSPVVTSSPVASEIAEATAEAGNKAAKKAKAAQPSAPKPNAPSDSREGDGGSGGNDGNGGGGSGGGGSGGGDSEDDDGDESEGPLPGLP